MTVPPNRQPNLPMTVSAVSEDFVVISSRFRDGLDLDS